MSWIMPNTLLWRVILASGILDQSLLMLVGPSLQMLTWSATSGYDFYKWIRSKPKQKIIIIECNAVNDRFSPKHRSSKTKIPSSPMQEEEDEDFVLLTTTVSESDRT